MMQRRPISNGHSGYPEASGEGKFQTDHPCGFFMVDRNGSVTSAGGDCIIFAGLAPESCIGEEIARLIDPARPEEIRRRIESAFASNQESCGVVEQPGRHLQVRFTPVDGASYVVVIVQDVTSNRKTERAEEALKLSEEQFRSLFHGHSAIMLVFDAVSGLIVDANQAAADFYGWTIDELRGMRIHCLNPYPPEVQSGQGDNNGQGKPNSFTFHHLRKDGSIRQVDISGNRIDIEGTTLIYAIIHDVTDRNRWAALTEFRLRIYQNAECFSIESLLREALDEAERQTSTPFSFFHFLNGGFDDGKLRVWSSKMRDRMSNARDDLRHKPIEEFSEWIEAVEHRKTVIMNDFPTQMKAGAMPHVHPMITRMMIVPVVRGDEVPAVFVLGNKPYPFEPEDALRAKAIVDIVWDLVARKRAELSESKLQNALMQIQKMELIGQLAGGVAHDFNNMLSIILGNAEMAIEFGDPSGDVLDNLNEILDAAERSAKLTSQLLAFARKQAVMPEVVEMNKAVESILDMLGRLIGEDIELSWNASAETYNVRIDPSQIDQILTNLCINARDAINGQGRITITIDQIHLDRSLYDRGSFRASGDYVMLSVSDNGIGIPRNNLAHIFEPFFTTKEVGKGSGLGLSTVYGIVKQNGGYVEAESEAGFGTEIRVFLPLYGAVELRPQSGQAGEKERNLKGTILLVEDEPDILNICKLMLEKNGYSVITAKTPSEALRHVTAHSGTIDLLLTDVIMPEMNGRELSSLVSSMHPETKVLFMSGYAANVVAAHGVFEDGNFIQKPFSIKDLAAVVERMLQTS